MVIVFAADQYWPSISGVSVSLDSFRNELQKRGHTVYIFSPDYPDAEAFDLQRNDDKIIRFKSMPVIVNKENRLTIFSERKKIRAKLDDIHPDIIHVHTEFNLGKMCMRYAKKKSIPVVASSHTNWEELIALYIPFIPTHMARLYARFLLNNFYQKADTVIVPTSLMETLLHLYFVTTPMRIIPTGISIPDKKFLKISARKDKTCPVFKKYPKLKNKKILFYAGRLGMEKNIPFLIEIFERIHKKYPDSVFVLAGDGPDRARLEKIAADKQLGENIIFTGFIDKGDINHYYKAADIFIFASKVESQGLVALEAMACGTPVVAIGKMGTREVMSGDNGGFMVDDDIDEFTARVELLLSNKTEYKKKAIEARHHAEKWRIEAMADKLFNLYTKLLLQKAAKFK